MEAIDSAMAGPAGKHHPAACHLYIHLMEMSSNPAVAQPAADRLRRLVPDGSHMQHMATHIDIACGDYRRGVDSNYDAMISDDKYFAQEQGSILYTAYRTHNIHVMGYAAMISGRFEHALLAAKRLDEIITPEILSIKSPRMVNWVEYQRGMMAHVLVRFGRWEEILKLDLPTDRQLMSITTAVILYARGIALAVLGRIEEARAAKVEFEKARLEIPEDRVYGNTSTGRIVLGVAALMLDGELTYREGKFERAFEILRQAVKAEDNLSYSDPPLWMQPVRHALGALLLEQNRVEEALEVYKEDLGFSENLSARKARPNNVWGLQGLYECFVRLGKHAEAQMIRRQHDIAVASADIPVGASCFCRLSKAPTSPCCPS
jgi:tetratricopeptide (TPR) repeat protein